MPPSSPQPPAWVYKRDGRLVPFEADKISRALFAATETLGHPDAFLARELTDGVVHFLAAEVEGTTPTTAQVRELVIKVVRELGQPVLAETFATTVPARIEEAVAEGAAAPPSVVVPLLDSPDAFQQACLREYSLRQVFARDLVAAQGDGLLTLTGLESPMELAGCVLGPTGAGPLEAVLQARSLAGMFVVVDGPEHLLAQVSRGDAAVADYGRELLLGLRAAGLGAVVNLNCAAPPRWADDLAEGPLFAGQRQSPASTYLVNLTDALFERLRPSDSSCGVLRIDWHLAERDFLTGSEARLLRVARRALESGGLAFVFDRPRRPIALAEGIDRRHPAVLLTVGLHLPRLAEQPGLRGDPARFVQKLGSLARLALSAAVQKREFLRQHRPDTTRGFLLERARLVAAPVGLEHVVRAFVGRGLCEGKPALDLARQIVQRLHEVLRADGRACLLETCLDAPPLGFGLTEEAAGLTAWDAEAEMKQQLRTAGLLHATAEMGTAAVFLPDGATPEQLADWLRMAWQQTDLGRVSLLRAAPAPRQLLLAIGAASG